MPYISQEVKLAIEGHHKNWQELQQQPTNALHQSICLIQSIPIFGQDGEKLSTRKVATATMTTHKRSTTARKCANPVNFDV